MNKCSRTAAIAQVAAHRLIAKALQIHKQYVGLLLKTVKHVCGLDYEKIWYKVLGQVICHWRAKQWYLKHYFWVL